MKEPVREIMGSHEAEALAGPNMLQQLQHLADLSPALSRAILEDGFGDMLANTATGYREWNRLVLAMLAAMGDAADQSEVYLKAAVQQGATEHEIQDVLNICYLYAGAPRAVNAARRMSEYLNQSQQRMFPGSTEHLVRLSDHSTMIWDSKGKGLPSEGVPMLLIHALDMDRRFWRAVFPALAAKGRVIAYDVRGHGHARGAPLTTSLDQLADDVRDLLDCLDIPLVDVYGASYGGAIAQHVALRMPERVRSMALIATAAKAPQEELAARATDAEQHGMEAQVARSCVRWFHPESMARDLWMVRYARNCVRRSRVEEWAAAWRAMSALDVTTQARELDMPVFVLSGSQDLSATPEVMKETAQAYKNSEFYSVEGGTHIMPMEQADAAAHALGKFRDKLEEQFRLHGGKPGKTENSLVDGS